MIWILGLLGLSLPGLASWAAFAAGLAVVGAGFNAWLGTLDWVTFSILAVCAATSLAFFVVQKPWLLFLIAAALVGAAWSYGLDKGRTEGAELGKREGVKVLQKLVMVPADGYMGKDTLDAIQKFRDRETADVKTIADLISRAKNVQLALGTEMDGYIGPATLTEIDRLKQAQAPVGSERIKELQRLLGVTDDGFVGADTLQAVEALKQRPEAVVAEVKPSAPAIVPKPSPTKVAKVKPAVKSATKKRAIEAKTVRPWRPCYAQDLSKDWKAWCPW